MAFKYPAFISYSSKDKPWADRLTSDLNKLVSSPVYLDTNRLEAGKPWNTQLKDSIGESEHLIVLYSPNAAASDWVKHEMSVFNTVAGDEFGKTRRLLCIQTDLTVSPTVFPQIQHIRSFAGANLYGTIQPAALVNNSLATWNDLVTRVYNRLLSNALLLPLALIVMTANEVDDLDWQKDDPGSRLNTTLGVEAAALGIQDLATLKTRYGTERRNWKPFGNAMEIATILTTVLGELNKSVQPMQFEWDLVDFLSVGPNWKTELARLAGPSVVLVDPLSLYHTRINNRFPLLNQAFEKDDVIFITLAPFYVAAPYGALRQMVRVLAAPMLDPYFNPIPNKARIATCAVGISDDDDLGRAIRAGLIRGAALPAGTANAYIAAPKRF